jgi:hypothetical protein
MIAKLRSIFRPEKPADASAEAVSQATDRLKDCLFLGLLVVASLVLYVRQLGFYSDDWSFLGYLSLSRDDSVMSLFRSIYSPWVQMRPTQIFYLALLYRLFGAQPLGYHLTNALVLVLGVALFYLALVELGLPRVYALAVPAIYGLLPHYSTVRFWVAAAHANLSMAFYFLSLFALLRALRAVTWAGWLWWGLALASLAGSVLAYEVFLPLFCIHLVVLWQRGGRTAISPGDELAWGRLALQASGYLMTLIALLGFKALTTVRTGPILESLADIVRTAFSMNYSENGYGLNYLRALQISYVDYGLALPQVLATILREGPLAEMLIMAVLLGVSMYGYLSRSSSEVPLEIPGFGRIFQWLGAGLVLFGLGYAIFLTNYNVLFTTTGIGNRTAMAAAVGVAVSMVGGILILCRVLPGAFRRQLFCLSVATLGASGFLINNHIASYWIDAYRMEQAIIVEVEQAFPSLPAGSTLILDGVCPYRGPAVVFESNWDLAGVLMMRYGDYSLRADVVSPNMRIEADGLYTTIYGDERFYPYGNLFVYHFGRDIVYQLSSYEIALLYFQNFTPDLANGCPPGTGGYGVPIF